MKKKDQFVIALAIYGVLFLGLLEAHGGSFWRVWCVLSVPFAFYHVVFTTCVSFRDALRSKAGIVLFPSVLVSYEYLRHGIALQYDGSGLTFCLLGPLVLMGLGRQLAAFGGVWSLTYAFGLMIALVVMAFESRRNWHWRIMIAISITLLVAACVFTNGASGRVISAEQAVVVTVPFAVSKQNASAVTAFVDDFRRMADGDTPYVLGAETMAEMKLENNRLYFAGPDDLAWQDISKQGNCIVLVGAWITVQNRNDRINAIVQIRNGEVIGVESKHRLAPFVESQPFGTRWLVNIGWVPEGAVRDVMSPDEAGEYLKPFGKVQGVQPGVCYDIFFGVAYLDGLDETHRFMTCSLDETYDDSGIFQQLSMLHASIRAIETGRSLVRTSLGGITSVSDPLGREIEPTATRLGISMYRVPICRDVSFYARTGDWIVWSSLSVTGGWIGRGVFQRRRNGVKGEANEA